jgi:hypothetical protein
MVGITHRYTCGLFAVVLLVGFVSSWSQASAESRHRGLGIETGRRSSRLSVR